MQGRHDARPGVSGVTRRAGPGDAATPHPPGGADAASGDAESRIPEPGHVPADDAQAPGLAAATQDCDTRHWDTVWQSEAAALATDRELHEAWQAGLAAACAPGAGWRPGPPPGSSPGTAPDPAAGHAAYVPPGPMRRRGPRPLSLHLLAAAMPACGPAHEPASAREQSLDVLVAGIAAYRRHPFRSTLPAVPCVWQEGDTRLLDYAPPEAGHRPDRRVPVLFVPSLVNRAQVLDLMEGRSLLRWLAAHGMRPLLLDWGWPGPVERRFTLTDYVAGRLERAAASLGRPAILAGYCMGGLLCTALATRRPDLVAGLVLLATPWDFHAADAGPALPARTPPAWTPGSVLRTLALLEPAMAPTGALGIDALQTLFELATPGAVAAKYRSFAHAGPDSERARSFVAIEDWLADGVPLAAPVARECLGGWYGANTPARGEWRVAGLPVAPETLRVPSLVVVPTRDRIVPEGSALALARLIPRSDVLRPRAGHVGMVVGSRAEAEVWMPLREWLLRQGG